jgi:hypothetical protein
LDEDRLIIGQVARECAVKVVEGDPNAADAVRRVVAGHGEARVANTATTGLPNAATDWSSTNVATAPMGLFQPRRVIATKAFSVRCDSPRTCSFNGTLADGYWRCAPHSASTASG